LIFIIGKFGSFPRIKLLKFRYFIKTNDIDGIYETWFDLISNNENLIDTLIKELSYLFNENSNNFSLIFFQKSLEKHPSLTLVKSIFKNFDLLKNNKNKTEVIEDILKNTNIIEKIDTELIFYFIKNLDLIDNTNFVKFLENNHNKNKFIESFIKTYKCRICGYNSSNMYWQCISCKSWESFI